MSAILDRLPLEKTRIAPLDRALAAPRRVLGVRIAALVEAAVFLGVALAVDSFWGSGNRFADVSPHPFWIVVLLAASYYGMPEGLAAVAMASAALLVGNLPEHGIDEDVYAWLLRSTILPLGWTIAALTLGQVQSAFRRRLAALREELDESRENARIVTEAYERLHDVKDHLEARVAGQLCTVNAMYNAWRAIERHGVGDVLVGIGELVRTVMNPEKYSLYLLEGASLEAAVNEGWSPDDDFARQFDASFPLFHAVVTNRRFLSIADPADEPLLRDEGVMAGPIFNADSGEFVGMLKIESIGFLDLHPSSVQNFRILCAWIGAALANAEHVEKLQHHRASDRLQGLLPPVCFERQHHLFCGLAQRNGLATWTLYLAVELPGEAEAGAGVQIAATLAAVAQHVLDAPQLCFNYKRAGWDFAVLLPGLGPDAAEAVTRQLASRLAQELSDAGLAPVVRHAVVPVHEVPES